MKYDCLKSGSGSECYLGGVDMLDDRIFAFTAVDALGTGTTLAVTSCLMDEDRLIMSWHAGWEVGDFELDFFSRSEEFWREVTAAMCLTVVDYILVRSCCAAASLGTTYDGLLLLGVLAARNLLWRAPLFCRN